MSKLDWLEVIAVVNDRDWIDWLIILASIITPIIMMISVFLSARATKIANDATMLNVQMYKEQREEEERLFLPNFQVLYVDGGENFQKFQLKNMNINRPISYSRFFSNLPWEKFDYTIISDYEIEFYVQDDFSENNSFDLNLYYRTLNHRSYRSEIVIRFFGESGIVIQTHDIENLDESKTKVYDK